MSACREPLPKHPLSLEARVRLLRLGLKHHGRKDWLQKAAVEGWSASTGLTRVEIANCIGVQASLIFFPVLASVFTAALHKRYQRRKKIPTQFEVPIENPNAIVDSISTEGSAIIVPPSVVQEPAIVQEPHTQSLCCPKCNRNDFRSSQALGKHVVTCPGPRQGQQHRAQCPFCKLFFDRSGLGNHRRCCGLQPARGHSQLVPVKRSLKNKDIPFTTILCITSITTTLQVTASYPNLLSKMFFSQTKKIWYLRIVCVCVFLCVKNLVWVLFLNLWCGRNVSFGLHGQQGFVWDAFVVQQDK